MPFVLYLSNISAMYIVHIFAMYIFMLSTLYIYSCQVHLCAMYIFISSTHSSQVHIQVKYTSTAQVVGNLLQGVWVSAIPTIAFRALGWLRLPHSQPCLTIKGTPPPCKIDSAKPCPTPALEPTFCTYWLA